MAWFIPRMHGRAAILSQDCDQPRMHGRQTVLFYQHGASPTACLYGLFRKLRPAQVAWRQTVLFHQHGASPTACLYGLFRKLRPAPAAWRQTVLFHQHGAFSPRPACTALQQIVTSPDHFQTRTFLRKPMDLPGGGGRGAIQRRVRRIQINTYTCSSKGADVPCLPNHSCGRKR
jgi:hypothetical protein